MNLVLNVINSHAPRLWNQESDQSIEDHDARKEAQHARQANPVRHSPESERSQDGTAFARRRGDAVCRAANAGWEDLHGNEPGCAIRAHVEEELGEREDGHQASDACVVGYAGPNGV